MLTEDIKQKNYELFLMKLSELGINVEKFSTYKEKLINASYALTNEYGLAFDGSLLNTILRVLTPYALKINDILPESIRVDKNSLIKVCLLHQISKCEMFVPNDNDWAIKQGKIYKYGEYDYALKMGMRSLFMCQQLGITLTEGEMEAFTVFDRNEDDAQIKFFSSPITTVIKQANELTQVTNRVKKNG